MFSTKNEVSSVTTSTGRCLTLGRRKGKLRHVGKTLGILGHSKSHHSVQCMFFSVSEINVNECMSQAINVKYFLEPLSLTFCAVIS